MHRKEGRKEGWKEGRKARKKEKRESQSIRVQFLNETSVISSKILWESPKILWVFKAVLVLHSLHSMYVFPFQPKLIFPVKIIKMFRRPG